MERNGDDDELDRFGEEDLSFQLVKVWVKGYGITQIVCSSTVLLCVLDLLEEGKSATGATSQNQTQRV